MPRSRMRTEMFSPGVAVCRDLDRVARRGILQGIGQEVAEQCEQQFSISVHDARQLAEILADIRAARGFAMQLTHFVQQGGGSEFAGPIHRLSIQQQRSAEQAVHDARQPRNGTANPQCPLQQVIRGKPVLELDQPLCLSVDHGQRRAEFVRGHGDEIALLRRRAPFVLQGCLERGGLFDQALLTLHQRDRIVAKNRDRTRHLADLVVAPRAGNADVRVVGGQSLHAPRQIEQRPRYRPRDVNDHRQHQASRHDHGGHDEAAVVQIGAGGPFARLPRLRDRLVGQPAQGIACTIEGLPRGSHVHDDRVGLHARMRQLRALEPRWLLYAAHSRANSS